MIRFTWPQYLRREVVYRGWTVKLTRREADFLLIILMRSDRNTPRQLLVDALYGECDEGGPLWAQNVVSQVMRGLKLKLPGLIGGRKGVGYWVEPGNNSPQT